MGFLDSAAIPDHIARLMSPEDRRKLGKGAITREEAIAKTTVRVEKELHEHVRTLLEEHRGIVVIYSRMDRKATTPVGTPDFIFAVRVPADETYREEMFACAWELKVADGEQSEEQKEMQRRMERPPNAWRYRIIRSVDEARAELAKMGLKPGP
jgi:hypothetical protein